MSASMAAERAQERSAAASISFVVLGKPATAGSKRAFPIRRKNGTLGVAVSDSSGAHGKAWRSDVRDAARAVYSGAPIDGPLRLELMFVLPRPAGHRRSNGELSKAGLAMPFPTTRPDTGKYARAFEDALSGVLWVDDAQLVEVVLSKRYGEAFETRATITRMA
jgi:Holliday junction resolvase RusA-like endonuclease